MAVPTLDAMTRLAPFRDGLVCPLLDARMGEVFGAVYRFTVYQRTKLIDDRAQVVEDLVRGIEDDVLFLGDGAARYRERIEAALPTAFCAPGPCTTPRAAAVAIEGQALLARGTCTDPAQVAPVYLRKSQAEDHRARAAKNPAEASGGGRPDR